MSACHSKNRSPEGAAIQAPASPIGETMWVTANGLPLKATIYKSTKFPRRLDGQPYFYPVQNEEYAAQIAREWNAKNPEIGAGFVTRFQVRATYLEQFELKTVGSTIHKEYWIPAEDLPEFKRNIVGKIEVIAEFRPPKAQ